MTTLKEFLEKEENKSIIASIINVCSSPLAKALIHNDALDKKYIRTTSAIECITKIITEIENTCGIKYSHEFLRTTAYFSLLDSLYNKDNIKSFVDLRKVTNKSNTRLFNYFMEKFISDYGDMFRAYGAKYDDSNKVSALKTKYRYAFLDCLDDDVIDFLLTEEIEGYKNDNNNYVKLVRDLRRLRDNIDTIDFRDYLPRGRGLLLGNCQLINWCFNKYGIDGTIKYMVEQNTQCMFYKNSYTNETVVSDDITYLIDRAPEESKKKLIDTLITRIGEVMGRKEVVKQLFTNYFKVHTDDDTYVDKIGYIIDNYATINGDCLVHLYNAIKSRHSIYGLLSKIEDLAYRKNEDNKRVYSEMIQKLIVAIKCCLTQSMSLKDKKTLGEIATFVEIYHFDYPRIVETVYASEGMNYKY